ncbi:KA1 domain-containing protein [Rhizoctonia solani AG-1 IA]|uniref:non-specific serine/threonine protein kinase n=1 Tax=Thanatephorus cucumeris (strain AG1-IA) TaxID=983506 RepID=L8WVY4_THACA|nr:KA1 domain-containing protein [Rhizoctonia solani AG-1 IA]
MDLVQVPLLPLHGIQFRRVGGDGWQYQMLARRVLTELKSSHLNHQVQLASMSFLRYVRPLALLFLSENSHLGEKRHLKMVGTACFCGMIVRPLVNMKPGVESWQSSGEWQVSAEYTRWQFN